MNPTDPGYEQIEYADLAGLNSLALAARARRLLRVRSLAALPAALAAAGSGPRLVLGGGSNVVLGEQLDAVVVQPAFAAVELQSTDADSVLMVAEAGQGWHALVLHSVELGLSGLENLALIPGQVGAAPIQNIGAYGVELESCVEWVEWLDLATLRTRRLDRAQCRFGYRNSWFKTLAPGSFLITRVALRLSRQPRLQLDYAGIAEELAARGVLAPTPGEVCSAVCTLRRRKLPDPALLPNAGSFFKNPLLPAAAAAALLAAEPALPHWPQPDGRVKLSAAWLIERCGLKGQRRGPVGVAPGHALVLVNHGGARAADLLALAAEIRATIAARFGCTLDIEPVVLTNEPSA